MSPIPRVVVLGGGFGGLSTANAIRDALPPGRVQITLVDGKGWFMVGFAKLWIIRGTRTFAESAAPLENLAGRNIDFVKTRVERIDPETKTVETSDGGIKYDYLVVALGARLSPESVPGLAEHGLDLYDHDHLITIRERLLNMRSGRVAVAITGMPYKCPPAPYEAALLVDSLLRERGVRDDIRIDVYGPAPIALPAAGPEISGRILEMLDAENIQFHASCKTVSVKPGRLKFEDGEAEFDLLLAVPPHVLPDAASAIAGDDPFIKIDREGRTRFDNVFAVGDITTLPAGKAPVPKAGVFAEGEGAVVAGCIVADITGGTGPDPFDGKGGCFIESGRATASVIEVNAFASSTKLSDPTKSNLEAKLQFERDRLAGWLDHRL